MENRKKPANPACDEPPVKVKPDDFEPLTTTQGPLTDDRPTPPPHTSYDCGVTLPEAPPAVPGT